MFTVNKEEVKVDHFPDGTQKIEIDSFNIYASNNMIVWKYEKDEELVSLIYLTQHIKTHHPLCNISLMMRYAPNARMDRVKTPDEVFTLKYFCNVINWLKFGHVYIHDPHSNVVSALLDRVVVVDPSDYIYKAIREIQKDDTELVLYFPDNGSMKRYADMFPHYKYIYGQKVRDWETGKILGLDVVTNGLNLNGKTILMIDDLCSYGGTFSYGAKKLKELGVSNIYAYATHTENSVLDKERGTLIKLLEDGTVEKLFTTDSLYSGKHDKIKVVDVNSEE